jgi:hypothetical protein
MVGMLGTTVGLPQRWHGSVIPAAAASTTKGDVQWLQAKVMSLAGEIAVAASVFSTKWVKSR